MKETIEESDYEKSDSSKTELEDSTKKESYNAKGKLTFVYKSPDTWHQEQKSTH